METGVRPDPGAGTGTDEESGTTPGAGTTGNGIGGLTFDAAMDELADVVARLEAGGLQLEASIALYERGVALHAHCTRLLDDAELRIQRLVEDPGGSLRAVEMPTEGPDDGAPSTG